MLPHPILARYLRYRRALKLGAAAAAALAVFGTIFYSTTCGYRGCPSRQVIRTWTPSYRMVALDRIPPHVRQAFIAVEDRRFFEHGGVDWRAVGRATLRNLGALGVREGASTLTMQVARGAFIESDACNPRSLGRKLVELELAPRIEAALSKEKILQLYLNLIYLGDGQYGVEAASRHYFGKSVTRLTLAEAALLAAMPRAPEVYDPERHADRATGRRNLVLGLMVAQGYITEAEAERASGQRVRVVARGTPTRRAGAPAVIPVTTRAGGDRRSGEPAGRPEVSACQR